MMMIRTLNNIPKLLFLESLVLDSIPRHQMDKSSLSLLISHLYQFDHLSFF